MRRYINYNHLTINERLIIKQGLNKDLSIRQIARLLDRSPSTISREVRKYTNKLGRYQPQYAQASYDHIKRNSRRYVMYDDVTIDRLTELIKDYTPQQMYNYFKNEKLPCTSTIYRYLSLGIIHKRYKQYLPNKGKKTKGRQRGKYEIGKTISKRPKHIYKRKEFGHWEMDTVYSGKESKNKDCLLVLAERCTRYYTAIPIIDRSSKSVNKALKEFLKSMPKNKIKTITCNRGKEFSGYREIEDIFNIEIYFTDPYCAWQKGTVENLNRQLRRYYPKATDISMIDTDELRKNVDKINKQPKKVLQWSRPIDEYERLLAA